MHHYLRLSSAFICLFILDVCVPFPKSQVLQEKGLICFIHCYIPNTPNTARHMVGLKPHLLNEWIHFPFSASLDHFLLWAPTMSPVDF